MNIPKLALDAVTRLIFYCDAKCIACNRETGGTMLLCSSCLQGMPMHTVGLCSVCGRECGGGVCFLCASGARPYKAGAVVFKYMGQARNIMLNLKLHGDRINARVFASFMQNRLIELNWPKPDVVTAVPSHPIRELNRGYNAPELIARELATLLGVPYRRNLIVRCRFAPPMATQKNADRMKIVSKNYAPGTCDIKSKTILVVDDISTTGSTLHVCSELMMNMGAKEVYVMAAAGD